MMTEAQLQHFRRRLLELKKEHGGVLTHLEEEALRPISGEAAGSLSDVPVHPADLGTDNFEEEMTLGLLEREDELLGEIDAALERIANGTYGRCERCGQPIAPERLEAIPYTRYCLRCARELQAESTK